MKSDQKQNELIKIKMFMVFKYLSDNAPTYLIDGIKLKFFIKLILISAFQLL